MNDNSDDKTADESQPLFTSDENGNTCACNQHSPGAQSSLTRSARWDSACADGAAADGEDASLRRQGVPALARQKPGSGLTSRRKLDGQEEAPCPAFARALNTEEPGALPACCHPPGAAQEQGAEQTPPSEQKPDVDLNGIDHPPAWDPNRTFDLRVGPVNRAFVSRHAVDRSQALQTSGSVQGPGVSPGHAPWLSSSTQWPSHSDTVHVGGESYDRDSFELPLVTPAEAQNTTYTIFSDVTVQSGNHCQCSSGKAASEDTAGPQQRPTGEKETQALRPGAGSMGVPKGCVLQEFFCLSKDEPKSEMHSRSSYGQKEMGQNLRETVSNCLIDDECPLLVPAFDKSQNQVPTPEHKATVTGDVHFPDEKDVGTQNCTLALTLRSPPGQKTASSFELSWDASDVVVNTNNTVCMSTPVLEPAAVTFSISPIEAAQKSSKAVKSNQELRNSPDPKGAPANMPKPSLGKSATKANTPIGSKVRKTEIISYPRPNFKNVKAKVISRPGLQPRDAASSRAVPRALLAGAASAPPVSSSGQLTVSCKAPRPDPNADVKTEALITKTHKQHLNKLLSSQAGRVAAPPENAAPRLPGAGPDDAHRASSPNSGEPGAMPACAQKSKETITPVRMESADLQVTYVSSIDRTSPEKRGEKGNGPPAEKQELKREVMNKTFELGALFLGSAPKPATSSGRNRSKPDSGSLRKSPGPKAKAGPAVSCLRHSSDSRNLNSDRAFSSQRIRRVSTSGKPASLKTTQSSWVNLPRSLPKSRACLRTAVLRRTGSASFLAGAQSDGSAEGSTCGNATVIKHEERAPKAAFQNASLASSCLKPLVARAHAHLLKGPSRKNVFSVFNAVEKSRQKNSRSLCIQTQTSPDGLSSEKTLELARCKTRCENQRGLILQLKQLLSCGNIKFEALTVVIQHLLSEREEALKQHKTLSQELVNLRGELVTASTTCEKLEKARTELQVAYEGFVQKLNQQHQTDVAELENRLKEFYTGECEKLQSIYIEEAEKYKTQLQEQFDNLNATHETSKLEIEASHAEKVELLKKAYETSLSEIKKSHEMEKKSLEDLLCEKQESLEKQINDLKSENDALNEKLKSEEQKRISREKSNFKNPQIMYLEQELESLKAVLEIKNEKLHQQDIQLMKMEKLVDNNTALVDRLKRFQQENEELKARMDKHMAISRQLSTEQAVLQESLEKESKVNKRLSMENEELLWKLHNGTCATPRDSPRQGIPPPSPTFHPDDTS